MTTTTNNNTTTTAPVAAPTFLPMIGKTGKVSATSEKVALVLNNVNRDGLTALARDGKGAIGAQARKAVLGSAFGLPQIRVASRLERDQWGNALSLLVGARRNGQAGMPADRQYAAALHGCRCPGWRAGHRVPRRVATGHPSLH